jgi:glycyl-tRNA synthetase beta chain
LEERLKYFFKDQYEVNVIASVLDLNIESILIEVQSKLQAIKEFLSSSHGYDLLIAYKRASNILGTTKLQGKIDECAFVSDYEIALFSIINSCDSKIIESIAAKNYTKSLQLLASMRDPISKFFDNVMVKDKDAIIANNRMLLLASVKQVFDKIANFDKL